MSGLVQLAYVTTMCRPGRWGVMGSGQFSHIIRKYTSHIHRGIYTYLMFFLKFHNWKWSLLAWVSLWVWGVCSQYAQFSAKNLLQSLNLLKIFKSGKKPIGEKCQFFKTYFEEYSPSCCGWRDEWVIVRGPCDDSPGAHQFTEAPGTSGHG